MRNSVLTLSLLVLSFSCYRKIPSTGQINNYTNFNLTSIKTENLSEEITGNDEIHWMTWLLKDTIPIPQILSETHDTLSFSKKDLSIPKEITFHQSFQNSKNLSLVIILIECDTEKPIQERINLVRKELQWANYHPDDSLQTRLYHNLLDDDLLGVSFYKLTSLQNQAEGDLIFTGTHLFDKYFYRIRYKFE